jgi:hypothetical protein
MKNCFKIKKRKYNTKYDPDNFPSKFEINKEKNAQDNLSNTTNSNKNEKEKIIFYQKNEIEKESKSQLVRDYIFDSLYDKKYGYFNKKDLIIKGRNKNINFKELKNYEEYAFTISNIYYQGNQWGTPSGF